MGARQKADTTISRTYSQNLPVIIRFWVDGTVIFERVYDSDILVDLGTVFWEGTQQIQEVTIKVDTQAQGENMP